MHKKLLLIGVLFLLMVSVSYAADFETDASTWYVFKGASSEAVALTDLTSNSIDFTNNGATWSTGTGFSFDGSNDYLEATTTGDDVVDLGTSDFVISAWIKNDDATGAAERFIQKATSGAGGWTFGRNSPGYPDFFGGSASQIGIRSSATNTDTTNVQHFCVVIDRDLATGGTLFIDGSEVAGYSTRTTSATDFTTATAMRVGYGEGNFWSGDMEALHIFKGANIAADYDTGNGCNDLYTNGSEYNPFSVTPAPDELVVQVKDIDTTENINNVTVWFNGTAYTNTTGNEVRVNVTADGFNSSELQNFSVGSQNYFNLSVTGWNITSAYIANLTQFPNITAYNLYDNASISTFNATIDSITYQTTTGVIYVNINTTKNVSLSATDYFTQNVTHNFTNQNDLNKSLFQSEIIFNALEIITLNNLTGNITIDGVTQSTGDKWYLSTGTHEVTFSKSGYFDKVQNFTITALQNETLNVTNVGDSQLKINATNAQTGDAELVFNFSFQFNGTELDTYEVTGGEVNISLIQGYNYTILINDSLHALQYYYVVPDEAYYNETLILSEINSILITFYDEFTGEIINGTNMTALIVGAVDYTLTTTNGTIYQNLIVPNDYEIRYYSTNVDDYKLRSAYFTLSPLSFQNINLYAFNTSLNESAPEYTTAEITFLVLDTNFQPVENARVVVQRYYTEQNGFVSVFERLTNSEGLAVGDFETIDAFYKYNVYQGSTLKFASSTSGVQFTGDKTVTIYITTTENYGESIGTILDLADVSDLAFIQTGNFTGYFEMNYTNSDLINICLNVSDFTGSVVGGECQTTSTGTIQISVNAPTTRTSIYTAKASGYDTLTEQYVVYETETKTFNVLDLLGNNTDINETAIFVAVIILTAIGLLLIRFPVIALFTQGIVYVFMVISPIPFLLGAVETTVGWVFSFIIVGIFILLRGKNE